jgi:squalene-associated FAD-dependent desaturase
VSSRAPFDAAVIGGGVAGLAAATALANAGKRVIVIEARGQLGGRATAFVDRATGERVDNGQHVLFGCYRETFAFLRRIGAESNVRVQPRLRVPYLDPAGRRSVLACPRLPPPMHLLAAVLTWDALEPTDRFQVLRVGRPLLRARRGTETIDAAETVAAWLDRHGQRGRLREWLWEPLAIAALNQPPSQAAAAPFVRVLAEMFGSGPSDASLALPIVPLDEAYALPARRYIESRGGEVRLHALARIHLQGGRIERVEVRGEPIMARTVIVSVPWFALSGLFTGDLTPVARLAANADRMDSKPILTVNLWYDRPVMDDEFVGLPGRSMQWAFDKRQAFGEQASHLSLVSSGASELIGMESDALVARAASDIAASITGAGAAVLRRGTVIREKRATFSLSPGQPARPGVRTTLDNLFLAGDWIDTGLPGTIESAALAGHLAARACLATDHTDDTD